MTRVAFAVVVIVNVPEWPVRREDDVHQSIVDRVIPAIEQGAGATVSYVSNAHNADHIDPDSSDFDVVLADSDGPLHIYQADEVIR